MHSKPEIKEVVALSRKRMSKPSFGLYLLLILSIPFFWACDSENAFDCLQVDGDIIEQTLELPPFTRIQFEDDIRVELQEGPEQEVILQTGENLISDQYFCKR